MFSRIGSRRFFGKTTTMFGLIITLNPLALLELQMKYWCVDGKTINLSANRFNLTLSKVTVYTIWI